MGYFHVQGLALVSITRHQNQIAHNCLVHETTLDAHKAILTALSLKIKLIGSPS